MTRTLSTAEAARILGLPEARVRELARAGRGDARRGHRYAIGFRDLVVLRAARRLLDQGVPLARVRRALAALAREPERPLSELRLMADGRHVAVCDGHDTWQPETGQGVLIASTEGARSEPARPEAAPPVKLPPGEAPLARNLFERALDLEDDDPAAAADAYERALDLDPGLADAWVNLGRLRHEQGDAAEAVRLYGEALQRSSDDPVAHFNLALALQDTKQTDAALRHYERALVLDPGFADAHYNLASLHEQLGRAADALRHYRTYQKLT